MKNILMITILIICSFLSRGQSHEMKQLLLNLEKLSQFKSMLHEMYDGYKILSEGYSRIRNISEGNFNIHSVFLDGLLKVSPAVKRYKKVAEIIRLQGSIVFSHRKFLDVARLSDQFTSNETGLLEEVYSKLLIESFELLEQMIQVLTDGQLRMNDEERIRVIDRIYDNVSRQYVFLLQVNKSNRVLLMQRQKEQKELELGRKISGVIR